MSNNLIKLTGLSKILILLALILFCIFALNSVNAEEFNDSNSETNIFSKNLNIPQNNIDISSSNANLPENNGISQSSANAFSSSENIIAADSNITKWIQNLHISGSPIVTSDGNTIYACEYNGSLYAFNKDGSVKWNFKTSANLLNSPALGTSGTIYVINQANILYAINPSGTLKWSRAIGIIGDRNSGSSPVCDEDENIYFTTYNGMLGSFTKDGDLRWNTQLHGNVNQMAGFNIIKVPYILGTPVISSGRLYITDLHDLDTGHFYQTGIRIICVNTSNGNILWENTFDQNGASIQHNSIAIGPDGTVYITTNRGWNEGLINGIIVHVDGSGSYYTTFENFYINNTSLYAFSPDGNLLWKWGNNSTGLKVLGAPFISSNGIIYILYDNGLFAIYNGEILWNYIFSDVLSISYLDPIVDGAGVIYISTNIGLIAFNHDGSIKWTKTTNPVTNPITIGSDGTIYFSDDNYLYALNKATAKFTYNVVSNLDVKFTDTSDGNSFYYHWDFGDGNYSTERNPTHTYRNNGNYTVTLTISTGSYLTNFTMVITVIDRTPPYISVSHPSGSYNQEILVNAILNKEGKIYYTIDGSDPVIGGNLFNNALITSNTTLRLIAIDLSGNPSPIYTFKYVILNNNSPNSNGVNSNFNSNNPNINGSNNQGSNLPIRTVSPKPILLPDLKIVSTRVNGEWIFVKIKNIGTATSSKAKLLIHYNKKFNKIVNVGKIAKSKSTVIKIKFFKNLAKKTKIAEVNYKRLSKESNYSNNRVRFKNSIIKKSQVDLVITTTRTKGSYCYIRVKNIGKKDSSETSLVVYRGKKHKIVNVPKIGGGKSKLVKVKFFKNLMSKSKFAQVNFNKKARESNYNNNVVKFKNSITHNSYRTNDSSNGIKLINNNNITNSSGLVNGVDLIVTQIVRLPLTDEQLNDPKYYTSTVYNVTIKNQGTESAGVSELKIGLSDEHYRIYDVPALKSGESVSLTVFFINEDYRDHRDHWGIGFTNFTSGEYLTKYVTVNYNNKVNEANYNNNHFTFKENYHLYLPNLKVTDIKRNGNVYSITIFNNGTSIANPTKLLMWYDNSNVMAVNVPEVNVGKSVIVYINFFPFSSHSLLDKYIMLNYDRTILESNYADNSVKFKI